MAEVFTAKRDRCGEIRQHPLLGQPNDQLNAPAPVNDGSFFYSDFGNDVDVHNRRMPIDLVTRLPLPILPDASIPSTNKSLHTNYHHHFYFRRSQHLEGNILKRKKDGYNHPENLLLDEVAGLAVRVSRGQFLPVGTHDRVHARFGQGSILPQTREDKFQAVVLVCGGAVSRWALDVSRPVGQELVYLNDPTYRFISDPQKLCMEKQYADRDADHRRKIIGNFLLRYGAHQQMDHVSPSLIDEFLHTENYQRKKEIGTYLLVEGIRVGVEPIEPIYANLKKTGRVQPHANNFVLVSALRKYIHPHRVPLTFSLLSAQLQERYKTAA